MAQRFIVLLFGAVWLIVIMVCCTPSPSLKMDNVDTDSPQSMEVDRDALYTDNHDIFSADVARTDIRDASAPPPAVRPDPCEGGFAAIEAGPEPRYSVLSEASGIVASRERPGVLWMHNDSGDGPIVYAVGTDGKQRGRFTLPTTAIDWEDIAIATCPSGDGDCLWIGDIGDNRRARTSVQVLAVPEPLEDGDRDAEQVWTFDLQYEGGPIDAEALVVSSNGQALWIIEKRDGSSTRVFGHPSRSLNAGSTTVLEPVVEFDAPGIPVENGRLVTGADLHPQGKHLLVRVYSGIYLYTLPEPLTFEALNTVTPITVTLGPLTEPQGEAIGYDHQGMGFWTISENPERSGPMPLNYFACPNPSSDN